MTESNSTERVRIWDLPTRFLHWLLAGSFIGAFVIATLAGEHSRSFPLHMLLGAVAAFAVLLRVVWGFAGSKYARFGSFRFGPRAVIAYLRGRAERSPGHNPANAWAAWAMFGLTLAIAVSGALIPRAGHAMKEVHELFVYAMLGVVGAHLAGLAWHTLRKRENIALGMIDGKKLARRDQAIASFHPVVAVVFVALTGAWTAGLMHGYDASTHSVTLPIVGKTIELGGDDEKKNHHEKHDDDD
jgi:cytochrome b